MEAAQGTGSQRYDQQGGTTMMGYGMGFGVFGLVLMVLFWGGLIALGIGLVVAFFRQGSGPAARSEPGAAEILDRRYARGEISREEYESMREALRERAR
jgi:putative membrane protein